MACLPWLLAFGLTQPKHRWLSSGTRGGVDIKQLFAEIGGEWGNIQLTDAIKYLGALLGPGASATFWDSTTSKFEGAAELLSALSFATPSALRWYSIAVQSVPAYLCSLQAPSKKLVKAESLAITHITNIPHQSIPLYTYSTLHHLNITTPTLNTLPYLSLAARCRLYMRTDLLPKLLDEISAARESDDALQVYPHKEWLKQSCVTAIATAYNTIHNIAPYPPPFNTTTPHLQAAITKLLWESHVPNKHRYSTSMTTLARRVTSAGFSIAESALPYRLHVLKLAMSRVPVFVQVAFVRFAFNAWNTTHRYGKCVQHCHWCGIVRGDRLEHYRVCSVMLHFLQGIRPNLFDAWCRCTPPMPTLCIGAFGLDLPNVELGIELLEWLDFLHHLYSLSAPIGPSHADWHQAFKSRQRVWNRYKTRGPGTVQVV